MCKLKFIIFWCIFYIGNCYPLQDKACVSVNLIKRYKLNTNLYEHCNQTGFKNRFRRKVNPTFRGNPKPHNEVLASKFFWNDKNVEQTNSLILLVHKIAEKYLKKCPPIIYYDHSLKKSDFLLFHKLFKKFPVTYYHGEINEDYQPVNENFKIPADTICRSYILFLSDLLKVRNIIGSQTRNRVVIIARSSPWKLKDFLASEASSNIVNLLVIGESLTVTSARDKPYVLYTHKLYSDGLGSNIPIVLTSWIKEALSRPHINLFPKKLVSGFSGHRFRVSASNQPPFIHRITSLGQGGNVAVNWDGLEYRLLNIIGEKLNFSIDITNTGSRYKNAIDSIQQELLSKVADIGMSGVYVTEERMSETDMTVGHSSDCAAFITLASKALPKYRAILGPFQWPVWLALIIVYLGAVFPIVYSDRLTLKHLLGNWGEIENMFWYVFGMFTNAFTFTGKYSWSSSKKVSTRLLIGSYWVFTIIITSCYTGSIIAFVTLPAFPETVDSVQDLLGLFFRVGTLDNGGWEKWFQNSTHVPTSQLYKKMEFVSSFQEGIRNVTASFFWKYAFLASKAQLEYLVQSNFTDDNISRRTALHLSEECFALFQTGYLLPRDTVYKDKINSMILLAQQAGLIEKINNDVRWTMQRSSAGRLLQARSVAKVAYEERQLTTADTEGMFLLMAIGYLAGGVTLISEVVGGITNKCRQIWKNARRMSTSWSSPSASVPGDLPRTEEEIEVRNLRKQERNEQKAAMAMAQQGFGSKEFNLTKNAFRDFFSSYNQPKPQYVLKNGQIVLENTNISVSSAESNEAAPLSPLPAVRIKKKEIVLATVDVHNSSSDSETDIKESLDLLDKYLEEQTTYSAEPGELSLIDEITPIKQYTDKAFSISDDKLSALNLLTNGELQSEEKSDKNVLEP